MSNSLEAHRLDQGLIRGKSVEFFFDGKPIQAYEGETIATALITAGHWILQKTKEKSQPRGVYCNIGVCHSCLIILNGERNVRACQTPVSRGCRVESQKY